MYAMVLVVAVLADTTRCKVAFSPVVGRSIKSQSGPPLSCGPLRWRCYYRARKKDSADSGRNNHLNKLTI